MSNVNENNSLVLDINEINTGFNAIQQKLDNLRVNGSTKEKELVEKVGNIKRDKVIEKEDKKSQISELKTQIAECKEVKKGYKEEEKQIVAEGKTYIKEKFDPYYKNAKEEAKKAKLDAKKEYQERVALENNEYKTSLEEFNTTYTKDNPEYKSRLLALKRTHSSRLYEIKLAYKKKLSNIKSDVHDIYLDKVRKLTNLGDDKLTFGEKIASGWERYVYRFNIKDFLLRNGLYIVMILVFILCGILSPSISGKDLFTTGNIFEILNQASPRIFLALGVAGLILLAGTDLSIGRLVGLSTCIACMFLYPGVNNMPIFGQHLDFTGLPGAVRIILGLLFCILLTTLFSCFSGFFSAKFKMHPFISTMGTQLIVFGLTAVVTNQINTGTIDLTLKNQVAGYIFSASQLNDWFGTSIANRVWPGIPLLLIFAIIGIIIVSFIWNRTKFGKNMYAVGGNPEAASVSGISVFWVTLAVFMMAGILYGFGGYFEGVRIGTGKFDTGTSYETDAIAACVVGGISFTGGIGKIRGAVIGAIIFTALTYALTIMDLNPYYQYIIKGIIIIAAVAIDCLKYLKKK